jgi:CheY-like chemotaxis protein
MMGVGEESVRPVVIVVDDDDDTCAIFSGFLQSELQVLTARSAKECLQLLTRERVDLVLLDLLMSEMDGLTTLHEIRNNPAIAETPVVVVTAWDDVNALAEAKRLGVKECLIKPVFRQRLLRTVRAHLRPQFGAN